MASTTVQELKALLVRSGFELYRTRGEEIHLAERPRDNLIMDSGVSVHVGEALRIRFVVRAQRADFQGEDDPRLYDRARSVGARGVARGFVESGARSRPLLDPGDANHVLDTWYEVTFDKEVSTVDQAIEELRFVLSLEKAAVRLGAGPPRPRGRRASLPGRAGCVRASSTRRPCYAAGLFPMDAFRSQGLKSVVYGVIVVAIGVVFVIQFNPSQRGQGSATKNECAAEVRGKCVSVRDFKTSLSLVAGRADEQFFKSAQLRRRVMDGLVERTLLVQDAERLGIRLSDEDLSRELRAGHAVVSVGVETPPLVTYRLGLSDARPMRQLDTKVNGQFDEKAYNKALRFVGRSQQEFREMQADEQLAALMRDVVRARVRLSDEELFDAYAREKTTVTVSYAKLPRAWFAKNVTISKDALDKFGADHKAELDASWAQAKSQFLPECRKARHILVKASHTASDDEKTAARKRIDEAKERIKKGASFEEVAREVSEDSSAADGGDLGCFQKGRMVKQFEESVFSMKPGEMSEVVETEYGFHVIKLDGVLKDADAEAAGRAQIATARYRAVEGDAKASEAAKRVLAAVTAGKSLDDALAETLVAYEPKKAEKKKDKKDGDKKDGDKKDKKDGDKKKDEADKKAAPVDDPDRPKVDKLRDVSMDAPPPGVSPELLAAVMPLAKAGDVPPDTIHLDDGYAVAQLVEKKAATREAFQKDREKYARGLLAAKQHDALVGYLARLREQAKAEIKVNQAYLADKAEDSGGGE